MKVQRPTLVRASLVVLAISVCLGVAIGSYHIFWRQNLKRFQEVRAGVLYRSGLASEWGLDYAVRRYRIRTVITALPEDPLLRRGWFDPGRPSGRPESQCLALHGLQVVHLPMGDEACWPWPTPWQFEEFFRVCDDRDNWPLLLHCVGGRHRTGVLSALFRLEYDRWDVEPTLAEMYSFDFGRPQTISEHNLRTYVKRPRPDAGEWESLRAAFAPLLGTPPRDYEHLVYLVQRRRGQAPIEARLAELVRGDHTFAMAFAARVLQTGEPLLDEVVALAAARLQSVASAGGVEISRAGDLATAAALVADCGAPAQQQQLLDLLRAGQTAAPPDPSYHALACGTLNRYTRNRLPYWRVLLQDRRERLDDTAPGRRYCDTVAARLSVVIDEALVPGHDAADWDRGVALAAAWFANHDADLQLTRVVSPEGRKHISGAVPGVVEEDLSRMRR